MKETIGLCEDPKLVAHLWSWELDLLWRLESLSSKVCLDVETRIQVRISLARVRVRGTIGHVVLMNRGYRE